MFLYNKSITTKLFDSATGIGTTKNCAVIGGSTRKCTVIGQLIGDALGELAKPSAKASSTSSAAEAINITAQIDV